MTNCNGQRSHLITGLQPFTQYSVSVTVCTIAGEGPMETIPSGMTRTDPGSPTRVQPVTLATLTSNVFLSWDDVQFNDVGGTYEVSLYMQLFSVKWLRVNYSTARLITLVMGVEILFLKLFLILPLLIIQFLVSTVMKQIVMEELELLIRLAYLDKAVQSSGVSLLVLLHCHHQNQ